ncbi:hypothetical protein FPSE_10112 [Fusarium pseudograminearum CS3096]|uniref:Xylanolytic transcriptional activator regulatory domain-containing protein n=1 Tax=Fusarium pseudograminearum (strain CS3096) TaxID=1028729 RepID=K3VBL5_FUSPC|nr:hypothetical protein FPSE_10112 [Fusarium pseudograminearum CS3096]EKJ69698.1 hypothetical protein FPSE_10112 [Fusarium pseudograminearum CS3096]
MPTTIEEHHGAFAKLKPKRQEPRKRSPKKHVGKHPASGAETETETATKAPLAPKEHEGLPAVLTDEFLETPNLPEEKPRQTGRPEITFAYYPFLCINNLNSLNSNDVKYLDSQGCLRVPESNCLDDLIRAFFRYAHPILPVINEAEFWSSYDPLTSDDNTSRVPLVLLSAMLFVACKYVEDSTIQSMQLDSAHEARDRFLRKTKLLYDHETESSPVVLGQVALLLAHWTPQTSSSCGRQSTQWLSRAIHHSHDAFSQAKLWSTLGVRYNESNLRRLLGCCKFSDCIHSLYNRRPLMMPPGMVSTESDHLVLSRADLSHEIGRSRVYSVEAKHRLIDAQEQMSALVTILGRALALVYPQVGTAIRRPTSTHDEDKYELINCKNELRTWYSGSDVFPISGRDSALGSPVSPDGSSEYGSSQHDPVELLESMMHLHYETAMLALCQSELLRLTVNPRTTYSTSRRQQSLLSEPERQYSSCILKMADRLSHSLQHQHLCRVPESMILCTALPLLLHLPSSMSSDQQVIGAQSCYPDWVQKVIGCLRLYFRNELEFILQVVKTVNNSIAQSLQESQEAQVAFLHADGPQTSEGQPHMSSWRELLDTRPGLFARLIKRLDTVICWGGDLPKTSMGISVDDSQERTSPTLTRQFRAAGTSLALTPHVSSAPSRRRTEKRSSPILCDDEPEAQLETGSVDSALTSSGGLRESFSDVTHSYLDEVPEKTYSPTSLDTSQRYWTQETVDGGRRGQATADGEIKPSAIDFIDADDMMLEDGLSDGWIDALLEQDMSLQDDNAGRSVEDIDMAVI